MLMQVRNQLDLSLIVRVLIVAGIVGLMAWTIVDVRAQEAGYEASLAINPVKPIEGEPLVFWIYGAFPDANYFTLSATVVRNDTGIVVEMRSAQTRMYIENPVPQVFRTRAGELRLDAGLHEARLVVDGETMQELVIDVAPRLSLPSIGFYEPRLTVEPQHPVAGDRITVAGGGYLPDTGAFIADARVAPSPGNPNVFHVSLDLDRTEYGAEVLVAATEEVTLGELPAGEYFVTLFVEDEKRVRKQFTVRARSSDPLATLRFPVEIGWRPVDPPAGSRVEFFLQGEFPTPGYDFYTLTPLQVRDGVLRCDVDLVAPDVPTIQVIEPFLLPIGSVLLEAGTYPVQVTVNGERLKQDPIVVPEESAETLLHVRWEGGLSGIQNWLRVSPEGFISRNHEFGNGEEKGWLDETLWNEIQRLFEEVGYKGFADLYEGPGVTVDGFEYTITYDGYTVILQDGGEWPEPVRRLHQVVLNLFEAPLVAVREASVSGWARHH